MVEGRRKEGTEGREKRGGERRELDMGREKKVAVPSNVGKQIDATEYLILLIINDK